MVFPKCLFGFAFVVTTFIVKTDFNFKIMINVCVASHLISKQIKQVQKIGNGIEY
jgi:hypothetical protein